MVERSIRADLEDKAAAVGNNPAVGEVDSIQAADFVEIAPGFDRTSGVVVAIVLDWSRKSAAAEPVAAATAVPGSGHMVAELSQSAVVEVVDHCFRSIFCTRNSNRGTAAAGKGNLPYLGRVTQCIHN